MSTAKRGFASMDPEKQRAIASKGGKTAHAKGVAHKWTSATAKLAGGKGGSAKRQTVFERVALVSGDPAAEPITE